MICNPHAAIPRPSMETTWAVLEQAYDTWGDTEGKTWEDMENTLPPNFWG